MAHGEVAWSWGDETRLNGKVSFLGVDMRQLLHSWSENTPIAGQLSGHIDFAGNNVHSGEDLTASADMTLKQAQLLNLPIFRQLAPYIAPTQPPSATFTSGHLRRGWHRVWCASNGSGSRGRFADGDGGHG